MSAEGHVFERNFPTQATASSVYDAQDLQRAIEAYRFFYPTVSCEGIFNGARELGIADSRGIMLLDARPQHVAFTANSDTPYATAVLDLRAMGPTAIELPSGPYIGLANDHNQRWIVDMGIPGPDTGRGGKYLLVPPGFRGSVPADHHVGRSPTYKVLIALRALPQGRDVESAKQALREVKIYPLGQPAAVLPYTDVSELRLDGTCLRWEDNFAYWQRLHAILEAEPALEEFRPMYGLLAALGIAKGKRFDPDPRTRGILESAAKIALDQMRVEAFASQRPDRMVWSDRQWEWVGLVPDDGNFETANFLDIQARDRWFFQAILASPAMFRRKVGSGSVYYLAARDGEGKYLDGGKAYVLRVPQPVPAMLFWSVTAYDARTRSQLQTAQHKAVLGSLRDALQPGPNGAVELHFGPNPPAEDAQRWIQTSPGSGYFLYFRIYGPEAAALDGRWKPGDLQRIEGG